MKRGIDVFAVPAADEINVHVRAHLVAVSEVVLRAFPDSASVNGQLTIAAAYAAFLGDATVRRVVNAAGGAVAGHGGAVAAAVAAVAAAAAVAATAAPAALTQEHAAAPLARTVSPEVERFLARSCLSFDRLHEIASRLERLPLTASVSVEITSLLSLLATITSGRRFVTSDDIQNYKSSLVDGVRCVLPPLASDVAPVVGPAAVFSVLKDVQSVENALCDVAKKCTAADVEQYDEYLHDPLIYKGGLGF